MNSSRFQLISLCAVALGVLVAIGAIAFTSRSVRLTILGFKMKGWISDSGKGMRTNDYIVATIALSNASSRDISYLDFPKYSLVYQSVAAWKKTPHALCTADSQLLNSLRPSQSISFDVVVERDKPCRVSLSYSEYRKPSRLWQRLPARLRRELPWSRQARWTTVATEVIDLRGAVLPVKTEVVCLEEPQETPDYQAAAQHGDIDAQFRLAGRYCIGNGIEKNLADALLWYEAAATNGHADAAYNLAAMYDYGLGAAANRTKATEWYRRASERGHRQAQNMLREFAATSETR